MPKLYYAGQVFELSPSKDGEDVPARMDKAMKDGHEIVGLTSIPAGMTIGRVDLANGNTLLFSISGSLPIAIESDALPVPSSDS